MPAAAGKTEINSDDSAWLAAREPVCAKEYQSGGTADGISIASCLLAESTARLEPLKGILPPEQVLKATDSTSLSDLSWYTTAEGSRIAMSDTQGDFSGGVIVAWTVIAGAQGFAVNPAEFAYRDGEFTGVGVVQGKDVEGHQVARETEYQFSIDYNHLQADPAKAKNGGYVYTPDTPGAVWR